MKNSKWVLAALAAAGVLAPLACKTRSDSTDQGSVALDATVASASLWLHPWELASYKGEMYLPDLFYAEASQNEQVMPTKLFLQNGSLANPVGCQEGCYQIDRLIYPTIGNPNLYVKGDAADEFTAVFRLEDGLIAGSIAVLDERLDAFTRRGNLAELSPESFIKLYLIAHDSRGDLTQGAGSIASRGGGAGVIEIVPSRVGVRDLVGIPDFDKRTTVRFDFDQAAMAAVPPGLYDVRLEVLKNGALDSGAYADFQGYEFQFNALRVFDKEPGEGGYHVVNVTDSQVSVSEILQSATDRLGHKKSFKTVTHDRLRAFVAYVNAAVEGRGGAHDAQLSQAAFITFNGDLHDGGSPASLDPKVVAWTYHYEAQAIINLLKQLRLPIFLTAGNHDGYASTGHPPTLQRYLEGPDSLRAVVESANPSAWTRLSSYLNATKTTPGGRHVDVYAGQYVQRGKAMPAAMVATGGDGSVTPYKSMADVWKKVDPSQQNVMLYDGFHQWRRTYGPLYSSWTFGKNHYVNVNSFDVRQHRRTGWGMYTVNYGGNVSQMQMDWIKKELAVHTGEDVVLIAHHDPRAGHNGQDYPYMFAQIDFRGMQESFANYVQGEEINPKLCNIVPEWAKGPLLNMSCLHDGLQEWMMADAEFDCERTELDAASGRCVLPTDHSKHPRYSAFQFLHWIAVHENVRTLILGHTHFNSMEVRQSGEELVPKHMKVDQQTMENLAAIESADPTRAVAKFGVASGGGSMLSRLKALLVTEATDKNKKEVSDLDLAAKGHSFVNKLQGDGRELAILRMTSIADLTSQRFARRAVTGSPGVISDGISDVQQTAMGFAVYGFLPGGAEVEMGRPGYPLPQLNEVKYYVAGDAGFDLRLTVGVPRTKSFAPGGEGDPLAGHFVMK